MFFIKFLFKKYALPSIKEQVKEKNMLIQNLEQQKQDIKYLQNNLENALEHQQYIAQELTKKIHLWQSHTHQLEQEQQKQYSSIQEQLVQKKNKQQQELLVHYFNVTTVPVILGHVEESLLKEFSSADAQKNFLNNIITVIKEQN